MAILVEDQFPDIKYNNYNSKKNIVLSGSANFDASASTGTFKGPIGAIDFSASTGTFKFPSGFVSGMLPNVISGQGATRTLLASESGSTCLFDRAAGIVYTLPAPAVGLVFTFLVSTTVTSNNHKVITDAGTTFAAGLIDSGVDNTANKQWVGNGTSHVAVTQNGTTTGGIIGSYLVFSYMTGAVWAVTGSLVASGTPVTPWATS